MEITPSVGGLSLSGQEPEPWITSTFAPNWYADAVAQARTELGRDGRRREIIFAVCAAESYLVEWVRDSVLNHHFKELDTYFPAGKNIGIEVRWKRVLKQLTDEGRVSKAQDFGGKVWQEFVDLVQYRNGLVHGRSSRPASSRQPDKLKPIPSTDDLDQLAPGWAVRTIRALLPLAAIRSYFKFAHRAGLLRDNPAGDIPLPKIRLGEVRALSHDECDRLLRLRGTALRFKCGERLGRTAAFHGTSAGGM